LKEEKNNKRTVGSADMTPFSYFDVKFSCIRYVVPMALNAIARHVQRVETRCYGIDRADGSLREKFKYKFRHKNLMPRQTSRAKKLTTIKAL
jgi:hypothetical protein